MLVFGRQRDMIFSVIWNFSLSVECFFRERCLKKEISLSIKSTVWVHLSITNWKLVEVLRHTHVGGMGKFYFSFELWKITSGKKITKRIWISFRGFADVGHAYYIDQDTHPIRSVQIYLKCDSKNCVGLKVCDKQRKAVE